MCCPLRVSCIVLLLSAFVSVCAGASRETGGKTPPAATIARDTVYSLDHAYALAGKNGTDVWAILDSIDRREAATDYRDVPAYEIRIARAFVASRELNPRRAIGYLRPVLASGELTGDPKRHLFALALMCNECEVLHRTDQQLEYTLQYLDVARRSGDSVRYACAQLYLGLVYQAQKAYEKVYPCLSRARSILERTDDPRGLSYLLWSREIELELAAEQKEYGEAIRLNRQLIASYDALSAEQRKRARVGGEAEFNFRQGQNLISLARLYAYDGQPAAARQAYEQACKLLERSPSVISPQLNELTFDYLKTAGRYPEALDCASRYVRETTVGDTINRFHVEAKRRLAEAYQLLGNYRLAWLYEHQVAVLSDSLNERSNQEAALELQTLYETAQQEAQIQHQRAVLARNRHITLLLLIGLVSLAVVLLLISSSRRRIALKNRKLFDQIEHLSQARKELERIRGLMRDPKIKRAASETNDLFENLETLMHQRELFRNPDLNRDQVAAELGTNKLYLSNAISRHSGLTFSEYLSRCRLEYAKEILLNDHTTKIEAIALMCGFNSVRTFYRLFQKAYQLTPSEFRRISAGCDVNI